MVVNASPSTASSNQQFDRVRQHTSAAVNQKIDEKTLSLIQEYARRSDQDVSLRIQALEKEWDTERVLEANASVLAFVGLLLGIFVHQNWFWLPGAVLLFLLQHAVQGWCPPLVLIRRLGVRTRQEIDQEKYVLKLFRGDFSDVVNTSVPERETKATSAFEAVRT